MRLSESKMSYGQQVFLLMCLTDRMSASPIKRKLEWEMGVLSIINTARANAH